MEKRLYVGGVETWQQWRTGYTATGQKWWEKDPQGDITRYEYDALDHKTADIAPTGDKTGYVYDLAGQMTQIRKAVGVSCTGSPPACEQAEQTFTWSPNGQKTSLTDARSNTTTFVYDIHDRLLRTVFLDATWEGSATNSGDYDAALYDKAGNVLKFRTREGTYMSRTYDNLDRKTAEQGLWTDGTTVGNTVQAWRMRTGSFAYTLAGRMSSAATDQVTKAWTYDTAGRPYTHTATMASGAPNTSAQTFTYGWDVAGNLTGLTYPGNLTATYAYDANNRMTGVSTTGAATASVTLAYDTLSRRTSTTATGNSSQTYAYELDNDLSSISHAFPSETAMNVSFSWTYDAMGRQISETISNSAYQYIPPTASTTYGAANSLNQYGTAGADSFTYRTDGPMETDSTRNFYYDERRNLTKLALKADASNSDVDWFDALGVRVYSRRNDPAAADPHRLELTNGIRPEVVWEEMYSTPNGGSASTLGKRYYVLGPNPDERLIYIDATQGTVVARYPHANKRGETIAIAKAGTEDTHYVYGAFGESTDPSSGYPWRYTGQRLNEWTGLYHYKARAYSPGLGRFLQPDPIGYESDVNLYKFARNDGLNRIDPDGRTDVYIGGAGDKLISGLVKGAVPPSQPGRTTAYFSFDQKKEALAFMRENANNGQPMNLIGHSYGADTAVDIAREYKGSIDNLVAIDGVPQITGRLSQGQDVSGNVDNVVSVTGSPKEWSTNEHVELLGRMIGGGNISELNSADVNIKTTEDHANFTDMYNAKGSDGRSAADIVDQSYKKDPK